jgi:hypothetical protein
MTRTAPLTAGLTKEVRALLPMWLGCMIAVAAGAVTADPRIRMLAVLAYGLGSIALGAHSVGHEYSHRTLALLLSQPADRRRLFSMKLIVLASMLAALAALASGILFDDSIFVGLWRDRGLMFLPPLCALFIAPWLTMICRSTLAGVVFTFVTPFALLIAGDVVGMAKYGLDAAATIDRFKLSFALWGTLAVCAVAAVSSWRMFMHLEAIEARGRELHAPRWLRARIDAPAGTSTAVRRSRHPVWLLVTKELRLQQMTFVVAGLYIVGWASVSLIERVLPDLPLVPLGAMTMLYFGLLAILIGSLASAEERQFGTLQWQALLPIPSWQQWAIKVTVVLGLALVLAMGLPSALRYIHDYSDEFRDLRHVWPEVTITLMLVTAGSLYISSLSTSGVRAMALTLPAIVGTLMFMQTVDSAVSRAASQLFVESGTWTVDTSVRVARGRAYLSMAYPVTLAMGAILTLLLLRLGLVNHRWAERSTKRVLGQAIAIAGFVTLGALVLNGLRVFYMVR